MDASNGFGNPKGGHAHKMAVLGLVDRNSGKCRMFYVEGAAGKLVHPKEACEAQG